MSFLDELNGFNQGDDAYDPFNDGNDDIFGIF